MVSVRGTVETGFRTPNPVENGRGSKFGFSGQMRDPARCPQAIALQRDLQRSAAALPADSAQRVSLLARADIVHFNECENAMASSQRDKPNLQPEISNARSLGLTFLPSKALSAPIDHWRLYRRNEIASENPQTLLDRDPIMPNPAPGEVGFTRPAGR